MICLNFWIKPLPFQCSCPNLSRQLSNLHSLRYSQYSFENLFFWYSTRRIWYTQCWNRGWWFVWFFRKFQQKIPKTRKLKELIYLNGPSNSLDHVDCEDRQSPEVLPRPQDWTTFLDWVVIFKKQAFLPREISLLTKMQSIGQYNQNQIDYVDKGMNENSTCWVKKTLPIHSALIGDI